MAFIGKRKKVKEQEQEMVFKDVLKPSADQVLFDIKETQSNVITSEDVREAAQKLEKFRQGKISVENRIISNEQWFKGRHWEEVKKKDNKEPDKDDNSIEPKSAWLFNCIMSKYADYIDAYPEPNILPREKDDEEEAKKLSSIIPVVLDQCGFKKTYSDEAWYKLKAGAGIYGIFWDTNKLNGLGDIAISNIDILNLFWEPGVKNIQDSSDIFHTNLVDNKKLEQMYPTLKGQLGGKQIYTAEYIYDDNIDTTEQSVVVNWYYKKVVNGKTTVHLCIFVNDIVLYATENDTQQKKETVTVPITDETGEQLYIKSNYDGTEETLTQSQLGQLEEQEALQGIYEGQPTRDYTIKPLTEETEQSVEGSSVAERGLYLHGLYPFIVDNMFPVEGSIIGFSMIDICKSPQEDIDKIKKALLTNTLYAASPRYFYRQDGQVNKTQFMDPTNMLVEVQGQIDPDNLIPINTQQLNGNYLQMLDMEINEMRETTGNTDVSQGIPTGVTSGSAISALQEAAGKTSRSQNMNAYMAYKEVVYMVIELIRQYYDIPRQFRIIGENGEKEFESYDNSQLKTQSIGVGLSGEEQYRLPTFDVEVVPQKQNPYSKNGQNETVMTLYNMGVFNPEAGDQALALVESMDFNQKEEVIDKIKNNQMLLQQVQALQKHMMEQATAMDEMAAEMGIETHFADDLGMTFAAGEEGQQQPIPQTNVNINVDENYEHPYSTRARESAQQSTQPK